MDFAGVNEIAVGKKVAIKSGDKSKEQKERILQYLQKEKGCRTVNIEALLNVKNSRAKKLISELVIEGEIIAEGANKNRTYCLKKNNYVKCLCRA